MNARHAIIDTRAGEVTLVADDGNITGLYFPRHWTRPHCSAFGPGVDVHDDRLLTTVQVQVNGYLGGRTFRATASWGTAVS